MLLLRGADISTLNKTKKKKLQPNWASENGQSQMAKFIAEYRGVVNISK
jgi:hypothetical protein